MTGKQIKRIRKSLFITQSQFGRLLGISKTSVNNWETGKVEPNLQTQEKIFNLCKEKNIKWEE